MQNTYYRLYLIYLPPAINRKQMVNIILVNMWCLLTFSSDCASSNSSKS